VEPAGLRLSLVFCYAAVTLYHGGYCPRIGRRFALLDSVGIFTLIAAAYTVAGLELDAGPLATWTRFVVWTA